MSYISSVVVLNESEVSSHSVHVHFNIIQVVGLHVPKIFQQNLKIKTLKA